MKEIAGRLGITSAQLALAWLLHQGDDIHAIPGSRKTARVDENTAAGDIALPKEVLAEIDNLRARPGARLWYDPMLRRLLPTALLLALASPAVADSLPKAIDCYQTATNSRDIDQYMACFTDDAVMIDVGRTFTGHGEIRPWAEREVMGQGDSFRHRSILESGDGYAKTEVQWLSWVVHYYYWWNADGKITKMSLQYAN